MATALSMGLFEKAKAVVEHHDEDCPNHCKDLLHAGQMVPEVGVVMLSALDSCTSNFAQVVVCNPPPNTDADMPLIRDVFAPDDDAACSALFGNETNRIHTFEDACRFLDTAPSFNPSRCDDGKLVNSIFLDPSAIMQPTAALMDDMLVDQIILGNPESFGVDRIQWLSSDVRKDYKPKLPFVRVLQHWCVQENIAHKAIDRFLKLLHYFEVDEINYRTLPRTGRTLLKTTKSAQSAKGFGGNKAAPTISRRQQRMKPLDVLEEHNCQVRSIFAPRLGSSELMEVGRYVHFGLESAIKGNSIGLIHRYHYRNLLRRIHTIKPNFLPKQFTDLTEPAVDEPFDHKTWKRWLLAKRTRMKGNMQECEPIIFEIRINADGAQWFESSYIKGTPILGKIVAVSTLSESVRIKVPYHLGKPFVIGIFEQTAAKPPARELLKDTIQEMKRLHPDTLKKGQAREGQLFGVQVICFNCDAPMRSDLKGTKSCTGYYGCERCRTKGVHIKKGKGPETRVFFEKIVDDDVDDDPNSSDAATAAAAPAAGDQETTTTNNSIVSNNNVSSSSLNQQIAPATSCSAASSSKSNKKARWIKRVQVVGRRKISPAAAANQHDATYSLNGTKRTAASSGHVSSSSDDSSDDEHAGGDGRKSTRNNNKRFKGSNVVGTPTIVNQSSTAATSMTTEGGPVSSRLRRSAGALQNRHKLAVKSKRKARSMADDEGTAAADDDGGLFEGDADAADEYDEEEDITPILSIPDDSTFISAARDESADAPAAAGVQDISSSSSTAKNNEKAAASSAVGKKKNDKPAAGGKSIGGSTYFPEIGAPKRTDNHWKAYLKPEEPENKVIIKNLYITII
jgi:hypothetical protein